jgi:hypothetical protein
MPHTSKIFRSIAIALILFGVIYLLANSANSPGPYIRDIKKGYIGVITRKYFLHSTHIEIKTAEGEDLDITPLSDTLVKISAVGDSIEKIPNVDYVILNKGGIKQKLLYMHIPDNVRNDNRWPKEWKNRWVDTN